MITITYIQIIKAIVMITGYVLLWAAIDSYRPNDKIKIFSKKWWIQYVLLALGIFIITNADKWFS